MSQSHIRPEDALNYHQYPQPGKIEVTPTKPLTTQRDLSLAYSPGVAEPCKAIEANPEDAFKYTSKGNLVAVISNGTAVLGLGNIGPLASKPVMEGKGVLFKKFAGIDVFDIEIDCNDPDKLIEIIASLEPTFGGINLEDIKAPECFKIETALKERLKIPVMHDDQHGTAIISGAALLNALELVNKKIEEVKLVVSGAGAAAISCARYYLKLGINPENVVMCDVDGVLRKDTIPADDVRFPFATARNLKTFEDAISGADVLLGLSVGNIVKPEQVQKMAANPIVFALANPNPEIPYDIAMACRPDLIMATGRSDHPNQVNNVLGFPYIFRGALDVRATTINEEMKMAATKAIAQLAKEPIPDTVNKAYSNDKMSFGTDYLIPKPLDPRLITTIAPAVAKAAMESGVAKNPIHDWEKYELELLKRVGIDQRLIHRIIRAAKLSERKVLFAEADHPRVLKAAQIVRDEYIGIPILLGNRETIKRLIKENSLELDDCTVLDPLEEPELCAEYGAVLFEKRQRKGMTRVDCNKAMRDRNYFGAAMLHQGLADAMISGLTKDYAQTIKPALRVIGIKEGSNKVAGMYIINTPKGHYFFADTTVNVSPTADDIVEIIGLTAEKVKFFGEQPRIALLSYSNFGSNNGDEPARMRAAAAKAKQVYPDLLIEGEMQFNMATDVHLSNALYPFNSLGNQSANTFIFPNLAAGNIAYKMMAEIGGAEVIGPILLGMKKPVHVLQLGSPVRDIVNMVAIAVAEANANSNGYHF